MRYISTRGNIKPVSAIEAIKLGMVPQGGLFVPERIPSISQKQLYSWINLSYDRLAQHIFHFFLAQDFSEQEIAQNVQRVYHKVHFESDEITPLIQLDNRLFILELFHGPTGAFKDLALQV
ncbi:MAG TPA: threonine synthase, partial [Atribacterota bacterium]|nr:threonine synthase [Atribacterota bacterium]